MAAPPPPAANPWFYSTAGQTLGPLNEGQLGQYLLAGTVKADTPVWTAGMAAWTPAGQVPQLAGYFQQAPPPPPPAPPAAPPTE
jgi:hypothetical protein